MKQKRQLIDHWVASRGPFLRFLFPFRDKSFFMTTGATLVRYEQPSEGSASPPCLKRWSLFHKLILTEYNNFTPSNDEERANKKAPPLTKMTKLTVPFDAPSFVI